MSFAICCSNATPPPPVPIPPLRAGEIDGRYIDVSTDLAVAGDKIDTIETVSIAISRLDGAAMTSNDLQLAGSDWPNALDPTGLIITVGFKAPAPSAGVPYWVTLTVNTTDEGRLYIRDLTMTVAPVLG
jgi:hypothetical protein